MGGFLLLFPNFIFVHSGSFCFFRTDSDSGKGSWIAKLGSVDFTLAFILVLDAQGSSEGWSNQSLSCLPKPQNFINLVSHFSSWLVWGMSREAPLYIFGHSTEIALSLLRHGQYNAVQVHVSFYFMFYSQAVIISLNIWLNQVITSIFL